MFNLNSVMIGSSQQKVLSDFYEKVIGKAPDMKEEGWSGWYVGNTFFGVGTHSEVKGKAKDPSRIIFNFETKEVKKEFERIVKLGGKVVKKPYDMGGSLVATFSDPDGNFFQLMSPWK